MTLVVDIQDWLDKNGDLPIDNLRLRHRALRIATLIEYGGPLEQLEGRETMLFCKRRPRRKQCLGMIWALKRQDDRIQAYCPTCGEVEVIISGWQDTVWADGPAPPIPMTDS
jgi:hypothetical protein